MSDPTTETKEWCVDWEVELNLTLTKTITHTATEIIEAATAEEAVQKVKDEMYVDSSDLDISSQVDPGDFEIDGPDLSTFKVNGQVTPWPS